MYLVLWRTSATVWPKVPGAQIGSLDGACFIVGKEVVHDDIVTFLSKLQHVSEGSLRVHVFVPSTAPFPADDIFQTKADDLVCHARPSPCMLLVKSPASQLQLASPWFRINLGGSTCNRASAWIAQEVWGWVMLRFFAYAGAPLF